MRSWLTEPLTQCRLPFAFSPFRVLFGSFQKGGPFRKGLLSCIIDKGDPVE
jgi:hypothetical protein